MKLWKISQTIYGGYDVYDSAVVVAETEEEAVRIHPRYGMEKPAWVKDYQDWASVQDVTVEYVGVAKEGLKAGTVVCASYDAG